MPLHTCARPAQSQKPHHLSAAVNTTQPRSAPPHRQPVCELHPCAHKLVTNYLFLSQALGPSKHLYVDDAGLLGLASPHHRGSQGYDRLRGGGSLLSTDTRCSLPDVYGWGRNGNRERRVAALLQEGEEAQTHLMLQLIVSWKRAGAEHHHPYSLR